MARWLLVLVLAAPAVSAQPVSFGEPFELTNARYAAVRAFSPRLVSTGSEFFLFWSGCPQFGLVCMAKIDDGPARQGTFVASSEDFDVVWTGTHFLVVYDFEKDIVSRLFDEHGRPLGDAVTVTRNTWFPRIAFNGSAVLLIGAYDGGTFSMVLGLDGRPLRGSAAVGQGIPRAIASDGNGFAALIQTPTNELSLAVFDELGTLRSRRPYGDRPGYLQPFIAGGEGRYLSLVYDRSGFHARALNAGGEPIGEIALEEPGRTDDASAVWDGGGWVIAYVTPGPASQTYITRMVRLDAGARTILGHEEREETGYGALSLAAIGSRVRAVWHPDFKGPLVTAELPLATNDVREAVLTPGFQELLATATSRDATLVVWRETLGHTRRLRAGIRRQSGEWVECELAAAAEYASAASDGRKFVVAMSQADGTGTVFSLTRWGWTEWSADVPFYPSAMAWNGEAYGLLGPAANGSAGAMLTRDGRLSAVSQLSSLSPTGLASDGRGFLAVFSAIGCEFASCSSVHVQRLSPTFVPEESAPVLLTWDAVWYVTPSIIWDGADYVVLWADSRNVVAASIPPQAGARPAFRTLQPDRVAYLSRPVRIGTRIAVASNRLLTVLATDGTLTSTPMTSYPRLATLPDQRLALLHTPGRITMTLSDPRPRERPDAPSLSVTTTPDGELTASWARPAQLPGGYRLEYRVGDEPWKELEAWINGRQRSFTFSPPAAGAYELRMRAFGEAGPSGYSNVVLAVTPGVIGRPSSPAP